MKKVLVLTILSIAILTTSCTSKEISLGSNNDEIPVISTNEDKDTSQSTKGESTSNTDSSSKVNKEDNKPVIKVTVPNMAQSQLETKERNWFNMIKTDGTPPDQPKDVMSIISKYNTCYLGDTSKKEIYLTFNNGYENGNTSKILDTLKKHNVPAAFFVLKPYITANKELILRMDKEGHLVVNHSASHKSVAKITSIEEFNKDIEDLEKAYEEVTGKQMVKFYRPPSGIYTEAALYNAAVLGYRTVFWSFAYDDWNVDKQYSPEYVKRIMKERTNHNGAIIMLHSVSNTNTEVLDEMITYWKDNGFTFKTLYDLP